LNFWKTFVAGNSLKSEVDRALSGLTIPLMDF